VLKITIQALHDQNRQTLHPKAIGDAFTKLL